MKPQLTDITISAGATDASDRLREQRRRTLLAPEDDMWATFADMAEPHSLTLGSRVVGRFSVDDDHQLHGFHVDEDFGDEFEETAVELFTRVVDDMNISAAIASTVDPTFLSIALTAGGTARPVAVMYDHVARPVSDETVPVRLATTADHSAAVAFYGAATGNPDGFLVPFLAERIDLGELHLVEVDGTIVAAGECRADTRTPGYAHLGLVVGSEQRGRGVGGRLMHTLTEICLADSRTPLCSTEPTNIAAQRVIRRAGFRTRHHVFRVDTTRRHDEQGDEPGDERSDGRG